MLKLKYLKSLKDKTMKRLFTLSMVILLTFSLFAQSPQKMSYQCVIRNAGGDLVTDQTIRIRISILQGTSSGTVVYTETQTPTTNANGLVSIEIGDGAGFDAINWASGPYFLKTETDPTGGTNYTISGTSQMLSVPYALYSTKAQTADYNNLTNKPDLSGYLTAESDPVFAASAAHGITNGNITNWNTAYGWSNHAGLYRSISWVPAWTDVTGKPGFTTVATSGNYNDLTNKPTLFDGSWTSLTGKPTFASVATSGNYNDLTNKPTLFNGAWSSLTGKPTTIAGYGITDAMTTAHVANGISSTNISNWNTAYGWSNHAGLYRSISWVPAWTDVTGKPSFAAVATSGSYNDLTNKPTISVTTDATLSGNGTIASLLKIAQAGATSGQTLKWNGTTWAPAADATGSSPFTSAGGITSNNPITDNFVFGSASMDNISGTSDDNRMFFNKTKGAFRAGTMLDNGWDDSNVGLGSFAAGNGSKATGNYSIALGGSTALGITSTALGYSSASGNYSTALGYSNSASGAYSTALGYFTIASGIGSIALGYNNNVTGFNSIAMGQYNVGGGNSTSWVGTDPLFEIGNGTGSASRNNAMTVLKNGNVGIGITNSTALLHTIGTGTGQGNVVFVGEWKSSNPGNPPVIGYGTRMMWYPDKAAFRAGYIEGSHWDAPNIGNFSTAMGRNNIASGNDAFALGPYSIASGECSTAVGFLSTAASSYCTALGTANIGGGNAITWVGTDPLFEIGNGGGTPLQRHNAMTVLKNGYVGFGTASPAAGLHIKADTWPGSFIYLEANPSGDAGLRLYEGSDVKWHIYNNSASGGLQIENNALATAIFVQQSSSNVGIGTITPSYKLTVNGTAWCSSGAWTGSDIRWKKNIKDLNNSLSGILELNAVSYDLKTDEFSEMGFETGKQFGLIAQDVEKIFPELVRTDSNGYKAVSYEKLSVILIEGIQEQQLQIEKQQREIDELKILVNTLITDQTVKDRK
jgi:hypothetical protein